MANYLVIKNSNKETRSFECKTSHEESLPYLLVNNASYVDLVTRTTTLFNLDIKNESQILIPKVLSYTTTSTLSTSASDTYSTSRVTTTGYSGRTSNGGYQTTGSGSRSTRYSTTDYEPFYDDFTSYHTGTQQMSGTMSVSRSTPVSYLGSGSVTHTVTSRFSISETDSYTMRGNGYFVANSKQTLLITRSNSYYSYASGLNNTYTTKYTTNTHSDRGNSTVGSYSQRVTYSKTYTANNNEATVSEYYGTMTTVSSTSSQRSYDYCTSVITSSSSTRSTTYSIRTTGTGYRSSTYTCTDYSAFYSDFTPGHTGTRYTSNSGYLTATNSNGMYSTTALTGSRSTSSSSSSSSQATITITVTQ